MTEGVIDPRVILGLDAAAENDLAARPSHHDGDEDHEHEDFDSVVVDLPEVSEPDALSEMIRTLARDQKVLRVKGYVAVTGKPMRMLVQAVGERVRSQYDRPWGADPRTSRLVVIASSSLLEQRARRVH